MRGIAEALCKLYSLTHAEARLAAVLANGHSLEEIADLLDITKETARWQIKHVFAKTGTNRQAELIRLLLTTLAHLTLSAFQRSASKPAGEDSVSDFDDEDELQGPSSTSALGQKSPYAGLVSYVRTWR